MEGVDIPDGAQHGKMDFLLEVTEFLIASRFRNLIG